MWTISTICIIENYFSKNLITTASYKSLFSTLSYDLDLSALLPKLKEIFSMEWNIGSDECSLAGF